MKKLSNYQFLCIKSIQFGISINIICRLITVIPNVKYLKLMYKCTCFSLKIITLHCTFDYFYARENKIHYHFTNEQFSKGEYIRTHITTFSLKNKKKIHSH